MQAKCGECSRLDGAVKASVAVPQE
jgi:hypothetical protein